MRASIIFMHSDSKLTLLRLAKEEKKLEDEPVPNVLVAREGVLHFHFCIYGLGDPYREGFYHGVLVLPGDYPFSPPTLKFMTPSGRFEVDQPICTTFTNFHKDQWSSAWTVRSLLVATVSFMTGDDAGGVGSKRDSDASKRSYALKSLNHNLSNDLFVKLFHAKLKEMGKTSKLMPEIMLNKSSKEVVEESNSVYWLYFALIGLIVLYAFTKSEQA